MRVIGWMSTLLLVFVVIGLAALTLGAFGSLNQSAPLWVRSLGTLETALSEQMGITQLPSFTRAVTLMVVTSVCCGVAAYIKPRH